MKKTFTRIMSLALALVMLLGMAASAETVTTTKTHSIVSWLGEIVDEYATVTTDEDGCLRYEFSMSENGAEAVTAFLQLGQALTVGENAESAVTITPEVVEELVGMVMSLVAANMGETGGIDMAELGEMMETVGALLEVLEAYANSEDFATDTMALYSIAMNEVNRVAQVAFIQGCVAQSENGEIRIELNDAALANLIVGYLQSFVSDANVPAMLATLKVWSYFGVAAEDVTAMIAQLMEGVTAFTAELAEAVKTVENTRSLVAVINETGLHAEYTEASEEGTVSAELNVVGEKVSMRIDIEEMGGMVVAHATAETLEDGSVEVKTNTKALNEEAEVYCLAGPAGTTVTVKSNSPETGAEEVVVTVDPAGMNLTYSLKGEENVDLSLVIGDAGLEFQSKYVQGEYVSEVEVVLDAQNAILTGTYVSTDGETLSVVLAPVSETTWALSILYNSNDFAIIEYSGVLDLAAKTLSAEGKVTMGGQEVASLKLDGNILSGNYELISGEEYIKASYTIDPETLVIVEDVDAFMDGVAMTSHEEGHPVITDDCISYVFEANAKIGEEEMNINLTVGIRNLEPENAGSLHGEVFLTLDTDVPMEEEIPMPLTEAIEFNIKEGNPTSIDLILKVSDMPMGSASVTTEMVEEEAPAHVDGYPISAQEIFQIIMSMMAPETSSAMTVDGNAA